MSHRTQITLTDAQYERLREESARSGLALAELVRRALTRAYGVPDSDRRAQALDESFGTWNDVEMDGEQYVEGLRRGMKRRLDDR